MADETIPDIITDPSGFDADGEFWLKAAQAAIRRTCGWHITPNIELSGVANSRGGKVIRLPARHVTSESFCQGGAWIFFILLTQILSLLLPE